MNGVGIVAEGLWKRFHRGELHDSLRDLVPAVAKRLIGRGPKRSELDEGDFWALSGVSFEVERGQALGIIGPNGSGKSTILKVLNRILRPNRGRVVVRGRVGALIEIAAGFHPDLTGRENVFLQGAIMGMRRAEIADRFDEIVAFSGIEEFIDTPVKRYSSGMNARLGFSVAAHLDPDVLLIDEVLAVGDFAFQRKAFARLAEMVEGDIPVVIVSHQLQHVMSLCTDVIVLDGGRIVKAGAPEECVAHYLRHAMDREKASEARSPIRMTAVRGPDMPIRSGSDACFVIAGDCLAPGPRQFEDASFVVRSLTSGRVVFATGTARLGIDLPTEGPFELKVDLQFNVQPGLYAVETLVWDHDADCELSRGPSMQVQVVEGASFYGEVQMNPRVSARTDSAVARSQ